MGRDVGGVHAVSRTTPGRSRSLGQEPRDPRQPLTDPLDGRGVREPKEAFGVAAERHPRRERHVAPLEDLRGEGAGVGRVPARVGEDVEGPFGLDGNMIDFGKEKEQPARELITEMLEWFVDDVVDELGSRKEVEYAFEIMRLA